MGKTYRRMIRAGEEHYAQPRSVRKQRPSTEEVFKCRHCRRFVCPPPSGSKHRNHCPFCLYSRHVDDRRPGDRRSACGGSMEPVGSFQRPNGEQVLVHRCLSCGQERFNRIAADDDFELVLTLPSLPPLTGHEAKAQAWEEELNLVGESEQHQVA